MHLHLPLGRLNPRIHLVQRLIDHILTVLLVQLHYFIPRLLFKVPLLLQFLQSVQFPRFHHCLLLLSDVVDTGRDQTRKGLEV